jgi:hypothetical protein
MADMRLLVRGRGRDIAASPGTGATPRVGMTAVAADLSITIVRIDGTGRQTEPSRLGAQTSAGAQLLDEKNCDVPNADTKLNSTSTT